MGKVLHRRENLTYIHLDFKDKMKITGTSCGRNSSRTYTERIKTGWSIVIENEIQILNFGDTLLDYEHFTVKITAEDIMGNVYNLEEKF